jgi:Disulphide bond corrector protein DsbC
MKTTHILLLAMSLLLSGGAARPQGIDANARVTFDPVNTVSVAMGKSTPVVFTFHIKPGFHVNSNKPLTPELIPTQLGFSPPEDLMIAKMRYPAGVLTSFPFDPTEKLSVYSGDLTVKAVVMTAPKATAGNFTVHGELKYQACDNSACYPPKRLPIQFDVKIAKGARASNRARPNAQSPHIHN